MKKTMILPVLLLIFILCGCQLGSKGSDEPVTFYYPWADLEAMMKQDPQCTAIGSEEHDISGNRESPAYVLNLYFLGPQDSALVSPFPSSTSLLGIRDEDGQLTLTLSPAFTQLKGIDLTIACTCLAKTCFDLTDTASVRIESAASDPQAAVNFIITRDNHLLSDAPQATIPAAE